MKRILLMTIIIIVSFLLQSTVFRVIALANVVPNLLLIITAIIGYMRGRKEGLIVGFVCGLLIDMFYGNLIGFYALIFMFIGYLNGICNKIYYRDDLTVSIVLVGISDFLYNFFIYVFQFLLRNKLNFFFYFRRIMLPEIVYTVLISVFFYKILHSINKKLEHSEKREV